MKSTVTNVISDDYRVGVVHMRIIVQTVKLRIAIRGTRESKKDKSSKWLI